MRMSNTNVGHYHLSKHNFFYYSLHVIFSNHLEFNDWRLLVMKFYDQPRVRFLIVLSLLFFRKFYVDHAKTKSL